MWNKKKLLSARMYGVESFKKYLSNICKQRTCWAAKPSSGTAGYVSGKKN